MSTSFRLSEFARNLDLNGELTSVGGLTYPSADGTNGQVLTTDGAGNITFTSAAGGGGLANVVEDTTPQLGGTLDNNGNDITITNGNLNLQAGANSGGIYGSLVYLGNLLGTAGTLIIEGDGAGTAGTLTATGDITLNNLVYPSADGTNGQVMVTDGSGNLSFATPAAGGISNVVEDTTPQLGGDLDTNGFKIKPTFSNPGIDVTIEGGRNTSSDFFQQGGNINLTAGDTNNSPGGSRGDVNILATGTNVISTLNVTSNSSNAGGAVRLLEGRTSGTNYVGIQAPAAIASNVTFIVPGADGTNGQVLTTDGSGNLSFTSAAGGGIVLTDLSVTQNTASGNGTLAYNNTSGVFTYTPPDLTSYLTSETTTTLTGDSVNQRLVFTNETGTPANIDLSWAVDDTNLARITSGSVNGSTGIATFTRDDASTFTVDFSALFDDTNLTRITSGSLSGTTLTLTRSDATTVTTDISSLDSRYQAAGTYNTIIGTDTDINTSGSTIIDNIFVTDGVITSMGTRTLTPADIGAQPAGTYNTIIGTDTDIDTSGSTIIDNIFVTDGVITSMGTRTLTPADIGALATSVANQNLNTTNSVTFAGLNINGSLNAVDDIYLANIIYHEGDTDTYMQFHNANEWRVVTGGGERLEVNSSNVTVQNDLIVSGGDITLGGTGRIQGIDTVSADTDAANKLYVDTAVAGAGGGGTELTVMSTKTIDNPNGYNTSAFDQFGYSVAVSGNYAIVGAYREDDAGGTNSGKAYIFDTETGVLLHTLDNPNAYNTSASDFFAEVVAISGNYAIVGAYGEDDAGGATSGKAYIFNVTDGSLVHTLDNPNVYSTSADDRFGFSVAISGNYAIVCAYLEDEAAGTGSGKVYIFSVADGSLVHTLNNPNAYSTVTNDGFGRTVAISGNYAIVGVIGEDDAGGFTSGKAYIFDVISGNLLYTLNNPNAFGSSAGDQFGISVAISGNYAIVGAYLESVGGKAYIYDISTFTTSTISSANYVLDNPSAYSSPDGDDFGEKVSISGNYAIVGAKSEDDAGGNGSGKAYIYDISTFTTNTISSANYVLDNPNAYNTSIADNFGISVAISGNYVIVGANGEDDAGGDSSGKAYIFRTNGHPYSYSASEIASFAPASGGGGGISNVVEDTTPQLGGNLDLNGNYIGHANANMKAYDFGTGSQFEINMQGSTAFSIYANMGSSVADVTINDDLIVQGGDITLGGTGRIQGIDTVSANTDAANKLYVDNAVAGAGGGGFAQSYTNNEVFN